MLPVIIGIGAVFLLSSCSRKEDSEDSQPQPNPPPTLPNPSTATNAPTSVPSSPGSAQWPPRDQQPPLLGFDQNFCHAGQETLVRLAVQDARQELCNLHNLLTGGSCQVTTSGVELSQTRGPNSLFALAHRMDAEGDYSLAQRNAELVQKMANLEGLPIYLADGQSCQLDTPVDLQNLVAAYSLLLTTSQSPRWQASFQRGAMGCLMRSAPIQYHGSHVHHVEGREIRHQNQATHRLLLTPGHLDSSYRSRNPGFPELPPDTPTSDCIEVRN